jgi:hypothetical protein
MLGANVALQAAFYQPCPCCEVMVDRLPAILLFRSEDCGQPIDVCSLLTSCKRDRTLFPTTTQAAIAQAFVDVARERAKVGE